MKYVEKLFEAKYGRIESYYIPGTHPGNLHLAKENKERWGLLFLMCMSNELFPGHISALCCWVPCFASLAKRDGMLLFGFDLKHGQSEKNGD